VDQLEQLVSRDKLDNELERSTGWIDASPESLIQFGSGWGTLEQLRRETQGLTPVSTPALNFAMESLDDAQAPWIQLLESGSFPELKPDKAPSGYMIQTEWRQLLEDSVQNQARRNWAAWMHLGIMRYQTQDYVGARQAWETSLSHCPTPWVTRNLALLAWQEQRFDDAVRFYDMALRLRPDIPQLAIECGRKLLEMEQPQVWLDLLEILPDKVKNLGRIRLLEGQAALARGDLQRVAPLFDSKLEIDDLREGERSLSHLWYEYHEQRLSKEQNIPIDDALREQVRQAYPVPQVIDFRMSSDVPISSK
jgi:tetratricopeptide (TPR) repeat protein